MAEEDKPATGPVDDALHAAEGTRQAARWIASALGAIPSLALLGSLVRAPGDAGFDEEFLIWGIFLAAFGALVGILAFAYVLTPVALSDADLEDFDVTRVPGHHYTKFRGLTDSIDLLRRAAAQDEFAATEAERAAKQAEAEADSAEDEAKEAQARAANNPSDGTLKTAATKARKAAEAKRAAAVAAAANAAAQAAGLATWSGQYLRRERIRADAYRLKAADEVSSRFGLARVLSIPAVGLVAAGVAYLALAPKAEAEAPTPPTLVTLVLNAAGKAALGCEVARLDAIRVGGEDAAPTVITFPVMGCPSKLVSFQTADPKPLGTVEEAEAVEPTDG